MTTFTPPPSTPPALEIAPPQYGAEPIRIGSHGYHYIVTGNTLLPPSAIEKVLATAASPKDALGDLQRAYYKHGYNLVAITGQLEDKTVRISVFQGTVTEVRIADGLGWFFPDLNGRNNVRTDELVTNQILAGLYAERSGKTVDVNVSPATNPGGTAFTVAESPIPDYSPVTGTLSFGNYGARYTSGYVAGATAAANLTEGLQLTASYVQGLPWLRQSSLGSIYYQASAGISTVTPYGIYGFSATDTHFREGFATAPLYPTGDILTYTLQGTQLLYADTATRISATESLNRTTYTETVFDDTFTLLRQQYNYVTLGGTVTHALTLDGQPGNVTASASLNMGISGPSGTLEDGAPGVPSPHFRYGNFSVGYLQHLPLGFQANLTGQAQWAVNTLPAQQQWTLGGFGNLTAWEPGTVVGDSGYVARFELSAPTLERLHSTAQLGAFLETGGATFTTPANGTAPWQTLSDVGVSLRLTLPYKFTATAMAAFPIASNGFNAVGTTDLRLNRLDAFFVVQKEF